MFAYSTQVLIPHYREMILISEREVERGDSRFSLMGFLLSYFADEWENLIARLKQEGKDGSIDASPAMRRRLAHDASGAAGASLAEVCAARPTLSSFQRVRYSGGMVLGVRRLHFSGRSLFDWVRYSGGVVLGVRRLLDAAGAQVGLDAPADPLPHRRRHDEESRRV